MSLDAATIKVSRHVMHVQKRLLHDSIVRGQCLRSNFFLFVECITFAGVHSNAFIFNVLKPTGYVMHQQSNIQQLYALPTLYLCVLYLSENKRRLLPLTA